jgi:hypothetical protein
MRARSCLVWVLLVGCGGAAPAVVRPEPALDVAEAEAPSALPPPAPVDQPLITPAPATCFEIPADYILSCDGVPRPSRSYEEMSADYLAYQHARRAARGSAGHARTSAADELAPRPLELDESTVASELRSDRCARAATDPDRAETTYALARIYYGANQWPPAYFLFDELALDPVAGEFAVFAASLALDSLNLQLRGASGAAREDCRAQFGDVVARYRAHFCEPAVADEELCRTLERLAEQLGAPPS